MESTLCFVPAANSGSLTVRERELATAKARSHAARTAYARTKMQKELAKKHSIGHKLLHCAQRRNSQLLPQISPGGLDPFLVLATTMSARDRSQLQYYLEKYTATDKFSSGTPKFCAIRDVLLPKLAESIVSVQCLLLISDVLIQASCYQSCQRRTAILGTIQPMVKNYTSFLHQSTAVALSTLVVAEYRVGNTVAARFHATALQTWISAHGGVDVLETFSTPMQVSLLMVLTYFNISIFSTRTHVDKALERLTLPRGRPIPFLAKYVHATTTGPQTALIYVLNSVLQHPVRGFQHQLQRKIAQCTNWAPGALILIIAETMEQNFVAVERFSVVPAVEFVQLLFLATESNRDTILAELVDTLLGRASGDLDVEALKEEIRHGYMQSLELSADSGNKASETRLTWNVDAAMDTGSNSSPRCPMWAA